MTISTTIESILLNANRYALNTWIPATYAAQGEVTYWSLGGNGETNVRPPASFAYSLAASLFTGAYDAATVGVSVDAATASTIKLLRSVAKAHTSRTPAGWGNDAVGQQSGFWSVCAGRAGWMLWEHLTRVERRHVMGMVIGEANYRLAVGPQFWKYPNGTTYAGRATNTAAEENAWNTGILFLAAAMMPTHPLRTRWITRGIEFAVTAYSAADDLDDTTVRNGSTIASYLTNGYNVNDDGTVVNGGIINPDYMVAHSLCLQAATVLPLAGVAVPDACKHGIARTFSALTTLNFTDPPYAAPGGTIYISASDETYYPETATWGTSRREDRTAFDVMVTKLNAADASVWADLHGDAWLAMQERDTTGQTFQDGDSFDYAGREGIAAWCAADAWMVCYVADNNRITWSNGAPSAF